AGRGPRGGGGGGGVAQVFRFPTQWVGANRLGGPKPGWRGGGRAEIAAVLRTTAGLDAEQPAHLHGVGVESSAVHRLCTEEKVVERSVVDGLRLLARPIVAQTAVATGGSRAHVHHFKVSCRPGHWVSCRLFAPARA